MSRFKEKFKSVPFAPKNVPVPQIKFSSKNGLRHFQVFIEPQLQAKNKKK